MSHHSDGPLGQRSATPRLNRQDGIETVEVALIGVAIVVLILMVVPLLNPAITEAFTHVTNAMQNPEAPLE